MTPLRVRMASLYALGVFAGACTHIPRTTLAIECVYQGPPGSDAFSAVHSLGGGWVIAGKRSSSAANRFLLSSDGGGSWTVVPCPESTGAHTYFFGQNGDLVLSGTGDAGDACLMRSVDRGRSWSVALTSAQLRALVGSADVKAVFGPVHVGNNRWLVNLKSLDTPNKIIVSTDNGATWQLPPTQPGRGTAAWARQMICTRDGVLLWPECLSDRIYRSTDHGASWACVTVPGARLFQPLCDAGDGIYFCGEVTLAPSAPIRLFRSVDRGCTWSPVASVNLQRPSVTYWRDVLCLGDRLFASACCVEDTSDERCMQLHCSSDRGVTWASLGNPYVGPYGGMQAIYQMCATEDGTVFAGCQPDSNILRWRTGPP